MSSIVLSAGSYTVEIEPAVTVSGVFQELPGETGYQIQVEYYNKSEVFRTRPTVDDGALTEFPRFN